MRGLLLFSVVHNSRIIHRPVVNVLCYSKLEFFIGRILCPGLSFTERFQVRRLFTHLSVSLELDRRKMSSPVSVLSNPDIMYLIIDRKRMITEYQMYKLLYKCT